MQKTTLQRRWWQCINHIFTWACCSWKKVIRNELIFSEREQGREFFAPWQRRRTYWWYSIRFDDKRTDSRELIREEWESKRWEIQYWVLIWLEPRPSRWKWEWWWHSTGLEPRIIDWLLVRIESDNRTIYTNHALSVFPSKFAAQRGDESQTIEDPCSETEEIDQSFDVAR